MQTPKELFEQTLSKIDKARSVVVVLVDEHGAMSVRWSGQTMADLATACLCLQYEVFRLAERLSDGDDGDVVLEKPMDLQ